MGALQAGSVKWTEELRGIPTALGPRRADQLADCSPEEIHRDHRKSEPAAAVEWMFLQEVVWLLTLKLQIFQ